MRKSFVIGVLFVATLAIALMHKYGENVQLTDSRTEDGNKDAKAAANRLARRTEFKATRAPGGNVPANAQKNLSQPYSNEPSYEIDSGSLERAKVRRRDFENGLNQEIWEQEDILRHASKSLRFGLSINEITNLLGKPFCIQTNFTRPEFDEEIRKVTWPMIYNGKTVMLYSPHSKRVSYEFGQPDSFHVLELCLDDRGNLFQWSWSQPNLP